MSSIVNNVLNWVLKPAKEDLFYLLILWLLSSAPAVYYWVHDGNFVQALDMAAMGLAVSYGVVLFCDLFKGKVKNAMMVVIFVLGVANMILDKGQYNICHEALNWDTLSILLSTNLGESSEFVRTYLSVKMVVFIIGVLVICFLLFKFREIIARIPRYISCILFLLTISGVIYARRHDTPQPLAMSRWHSVFVLKEELYRTMEKSVNLQKYRQNPCVAATDSLPRNVFVIIGESVSKSHCSLYDYPKPTFPALGELKEKDSLVVFSDVTSAFYNTGTSFKKMFCQNDVKEGVKWYERLTIFDVLKKGGFYSEWISNQSQVGGYDNVTTSIAGLADTAIWCGNRKAGLYKGDFDSILLPEVSTNLKNRQSDNTCYFVHMMGCHELFSLRCPEEYKVFAASDYLECPENQRQIRADYDNAVRYSDYIVGEIIRECNDKESVVIFVPDHSLDIFETDPTYAGHATSGREGSVQYGTAIPMTVYCSSKYRDRFPDKFEHLKAIKDEPFNTENLMYLIMDVCNVSLAENEVAE